MKISIVDLDDLKTAAISTEEYPRYVEFTEEVKDALKFGLTIKPNLVTISEAAEFLNMPAPSMYYHASRGTLPGAVKIGGRWRINLTVLKESYQL